MLRLNKSTRYALYAAIELARSRDDGTVTAAQVAERYRIPATVVAKVFQQLVRAGIAVGIRGSGGGYRLARGPSETTMLEVIEAFEPLRARVEGALPDSGEESCRRRAERRLRELFDEVDELTRCTFASISLGTLVGEPQPGMST